LREKDDYYLLIQTMKNYLHEKLSPLDGQPLPPIEPEADLVEMTPEGFEKFLSQFDGPLMNLTMVCVWHDPSTWPKLDDGQLYVLGICENHLRLKAVIDRE